MLRVCNLGCRVLTNRISSAQCLGASVTDDNFHTPDTIQKKSRPRSFCIKFKSQK